MSVVLLTLLLLVTLDIMELKKHTCCHFSCKNEKMLKFQILRDHVSQKCRSNTSATPAIIKSKTNILPITFYHSFIKNKKELKKCQEIRTKKRISVLDGLSQLWITNMSIGEN